MRRAAIAAALALTLAPARAQTYRGLIGAEIEGGAEGARSRMFVDLGKVFRPFTLPNSSAPAPADENGWPLSDTQAVFFDIRPIPAWAPPIDDPARFQPDWSGTYRLSFEGQATITNAGESALIANQRYDEATNLTTAEVIVPRETGLLILSFTNTRRTPASAPGSGFRNLKLIRPGYAADTTQVFTTEFLLSVMPFSVLRFMGFTDTNGHDPAYTDADNKTEWSERHVPSDATQQNYGKKHGFAWEYVVLLANVTGKDIWINVPVSATDDYVRELARLLHDTLRPGLKIYIEHGNEVWNSIFTGYGWNRAAAEAEVRAGGSTLNIDGATDPEEWARRRHARRLIEIGNIFEEVYGSDAIPALIRPVYAHWTIFPNQYAGVLNWVKSTYGAPDRFFYAMAQTHYFNDEQARQNGVSVEGVLQRMRTDSDNGVGYTRQLNAVARSFGLKHVVYEGGPDNGGGSTVNIGNRILANRHPGMKDVIIHDIKDNWFAQGGDLYMYFTLSSAYSRYGCWGATEDIVNLGTVKLQALYELLGMTAAPAIAPGGVVNGATFEDPIALGSFFSIFGSNFADKDYFWDSAIADGKTLPSVLGGLRVRIGGKDGYIHYAGAGQMNVLAPPDLPAGPATVEVIAAHGGSSAEVTIEEQAPGFFTYPLGGNLQIAALIANTAIRVAPEDALPGVESRPAREGDYLQLYANGLGRTAEPYPTGQVLTGVYPVPDLSRISVTVDGVPVPVLFAGMTYAGLFQVNIQTPALERKGDLPVVLTIGDASTQSGAVLTFGK